MDLYGSYTSPFVRHCRLILLNNKIDFTLIETDHSVSAKTSPTKRVPYLEDGEIKLFDSSSIIHHLRDISKQEFLATPKDTELFAVANTALDTMINLLLLKINGVEDSENLYLQRQHGRIADSLTYLNNNAPSEVTPENDADLRLACLLDWAQLRKLMVVEDYPKLQAFLATMNTWETFIQTSPDKTA